MSNLPKYDVATEGDNLHCEPAAPYRYIDSKDYDALLHNDHNLPHVLQAGGIFLCLDGEGDVIINEQKYHICSNTMCLAFPGTIVQSFHPSDEFRSYTLAIDIDFLREINIPSAASLYMTINDNPCVAISQDQVDTIMELCVMMQRKGLLSDHPFRKDITSRLLMILCYEIANIYTQYNPVRKQQCTRQESLFRNFVSLLNTDIRISREVQYYADKLCITPKYLTIIARQVSGQSAANWITYNAILNAKTLLSGSQLTIQQISNELNFPNPSFFGQYFLRHTGMTPKQFRRSKQ